jgi:hypothetical protein
MQVNLGQLVLGVIALVADLISISMFVFSGQVVNFWSATWLVMLVVIAGLLALGLFFIQQSQSKTAASALTLVSGVYGLLACAATLIALVALGDRTLNFWGFLGAVVLMLFPLAMSAATGAVTPWPDRIGRVVSYFFASTGLLAFLILAMRYMEGATYAWSMLGEAFVLMFIWAAFGLFAYGIGQPQLQSPSSPTQGDA